MKLPIAIYSLYTKIYEMKNNKNSLDLTNINWKPFDILRMNIDQKLVEKGT